MKGKPTDAAIRAAVTEARLPQGTDGEHLVLGVRTAVDIYTARIAAYPQCHVKGRGTANAVRKEIEGLLKRARRFQSGLDKVDELAKGWRHISPAALAFLSTRTRAGVPLPKQERLEDPATAQEEAAVLLALVQFGGEYIPGRKRQTGRRSRSTFKPYTWAPLVPPNRPPQEAAFELIQWLAVAYFESTGDMPPETSGEYEAKGASDKTAGPFTRLVKSVLHLLEEDGINAVELVKRYGQERRKASQEPARNLSASFS